MKRTKLQDCGIFVEFNTIASVQCAVQTLLLQTIGTTKSVLIKPVNFKGNVSGGIKKTVFQRVKKIQAGNIQ